MACASFIIFSILQRHIISSQLTAPLPPHALTPHLSILPPSLWGQGAYGFAGQEIREMCQPVVLNKHIFHFFLFSLLLQLLFPVLLLLASSLHSVSLNSLLSQSPHLFRLCDSWVQLRAKSLLSCRRERFCYICG